MLISSFTQLKMRSYVKVVFSFQKKVVDEMPPNIKLTACWNSSPVFYFQVLNTEDQSQWQKHFVQCWDFCLSKLIFGCQDKTAWHPLYYLFYKKKYRLHRRVAMWTSNLMSLHDVDKLQTILIQIQSSKTHQNCTDNTLDVLLQAFIVKSFPSRQF